MHKQKKQIWVIELGHLSKHYISGGDLLVQNMLPHIKNNFEWHIIIPEIAYYHWHDQKNVNFHIIPNVLLRNFGNPFVIFFIYVWRIVITLFILLKNSKSIHVLYSSTNVFVDVIPAYIVKKLKPNYFWCSRIHHLVPPPKYRVGNYFVNLISYIIDEGCIHLLAFSDLILVLNFRLKNTVISKNNRLKNKVKILGGGVNYDFIRNLKPLKRITEYTGVFIGRLHRTKGIFDLPLIWKEVIKFYPKAKLAIIGGTLDINLISLLKRKISDLRLIHNIKIFGFISENRKLSLLKKSRVFLFSDHENGFSLASVEAMAAGLPVVGYDIGLLGSVFKKGLIIAPLKDYHGFAQKIVRLLQDKYYYRKMSKEALDQAKMYDWRITANKFDQLLSTKLKKHNYKYDLKHS